LLLLVGFRELAAAGVALRMKELPTTLAVTVEEAHRLKAVREGTRLALARLAGKSV